MNFGRYHVPFTSHLNAEGVDIAMQRRLELLSEKGVVTQSDFATDEPESYGAQSVPELDQPKSNILNFVHPEPDLGRSTEGNQYCDLELPLKQIGFVVMKLDLRNKAQG